MQAGTARLVPKKYSFKDPKVHTSSTHKHAFSLHGIEAWPSSDVWMQFERLVQAGTSVPDRFDVSRLRDGILASRPGTLHCCLLFMIFIYSWLGYLHLFFMHRPGVSRCAKYTMSNITIYATHCIVSKAIWRMHKEMLIQVAVLLIMPWYENSALMRQVPLLYKV